MSNRHNEDFDSIYASIDDDDDDELEELYVDVSSSPKSTPSIGGPSPYVYPSSPRNYIKNRPPSPSARKLPPLPVKSTIEAASNPPWPRPAPQPSPDQVSIKLNTVPICSEPNRNIPLPLPRAATVKKKDRKKQAASKSRQDSSQWHQQQQNTKKGDYTPPPSVIPSNRSGGYTQGDNSTARYQDMALRDLYTTKGEDPCYKKASPSMNPPLATRKFQNLPPPDEAPPPPPRNNKFSGWQDSASSDGTEFPGSSYTLDPPDVEDEYEYLRPAAAKHRLKRGYGQQNRRSRRYSGDRIPLQDFAGSNNEDRFGESSHQGQREKTEGGREGDNSRIVCILLTIIVVALLISLMSLVMSLYTLTRFELYLRSNNTASECDIKVTNCTTDLSNLLCQQVS